jgi:hypothetical protein
VPGELPHESVERAYRRLLQVCLLSEKRGSRADILQPDGDESLRAPSPYRAATAARIPALQQAGFERPSVRRRDVPENLTGRRVLCRTIIHQRGAQLRANGGIEVRVEVSRCPRIARRRRPGEEIVLAAYVPRNGHIDSNGTTGCQGHIGARSVAREAHDDPARSPAVAWAASRPAAGTREQGRGGKARQGGVAHCTSDRRESHRGEGREHTGRRKRSSGLARGFLHKETLADY